MPSMPRRWNWAGATRARPGCAATRDHRLSTAPISAISMATSSPPFASVRPPECFLPSSCWGGEPAKLVEGFCGAERTPPPPSAVPLPEKSRGGMMVAVILNRNKGDRDEVARALSGAGIAATIEAVDGDEIRGQAEAAVKRGAGTVIVGGGDGSVSRA